MLTEYITKDGDRIDSIASFAYGNPFKWAPILDQNPSLPILGLYPAGIKILIPVVEDVDIVEADKLPIWKQ
jgi:phage tail protein X